MCSGEGRVLGREQLRRRATRLFYGPCIPLVLLSHAMHWKFNAAAQRCSVDTLRPHGLHGRCPRSEEHSKIAEVGGLSVEGTYCASSL